jgi:Nickel responsive protein SCO4226-like
VPRYIVERRFNVTEDAMPTLGRKSNTVLRDEVMSVRWELSHVVVGDDGLVTTFCIYDAPGEEQILQHARLLGEHHIASMHEIAADVTPADFPLDEPAA